jgi:phosphatidylinositol-3-phosphatase
MPFSGGFWNSIMDGLRVCSVSVCSVCSWIVCAAILTAAFPACAESNLKRDPVRALPKPGHVFIIVLENEGYHITFGPKSPAVYLKHLAHSGALLRNYYGTGHNSLGNYIAMISAQAPNPVTQSDCQDYIDFSQTGTGDHGQALGMGCVYPPSVLTLVNQIEVKQLSWKGYMEDMGNDPNREKASCGQPINASPDSTQKAEKGDQYAARHNPFVYFHSIVDDAAGCAAHVVNFAALASDLKEERTTPNFAFITPNLCHDGHDPGASGKSCIDGEPGGLTSADKFLKANVPAILASPAYKHDGLLIITFDESDIDIDDNAKTGKETFKGDASACCNERPAPNIKPGATVFDDPDSGPGIVGPGGGRIGAVLLSPYIRPGTISNISYNHYSMLRSIEDFFAVEHLGYAGQDGLKSFGRDTFNRPKR